MAAITPDSILKESLGSLTLHIATFHTTTIDDADTWTTSIPSIVTAWSKITTALTSASSTALAVSVSNYGTGAMKFTTGIADLAGVVFVLSRS